MEKLNNLTKEDLISVDGGCFSFDAGWLIGNLISGSFLSPAGIVQAGASYGTHYANATQCQ